MSTKTKLLCFLWIFIVQPCFAQSPEDVYSATEKNRVIGYLPGWKTPPPATELAKAGYTHILISFGVFSTKNPGEIIPAFDTVNIDYIKSLQNSGIKVMLSLGGASSSLSDTTVNFHQVLAEASGSDVFAETFIKSLESLMSQYGFDGFDFDIESGLNAGGTFSLPTGDIATLANIINSLHLKHPNLLISLAPQIANIASTSGFSETWGNYAALIMQTHSSLSWIGIQLYNSGCAYGVNSICYDPNNTTSPDASVAFATDLLLDWPTIDPEGRATGFQPYKSYLNPNQIVLGYPIQNANGQSDGSPAASLPMIKRAIQCLRTAQAGTDSCDTYTPPRPYAYLGGVFGWDVTFDQSNGYKFAQELKYSLTHQNNTP